jgi:hypothetical protein
MFNNSVGKSVDELRKELKGKLKNVGEKFQSMAASGELQCAAKNAAYKATLGAGTLGVASIMSSAIATGSITSVLGLAGLEALLHKMWEKYATRHSHYNTILFTIEEIILLEKVLDEQGRSIKDIELHEIRALHDMIAPLVEEFQRKKLDQYNK